MEDNPLEMTPERERRIRERAYYLWLKDGCPEGRGDEYWERARELQGIAESGGSGQLPAPDPDAEPMDQPVEEAEIMENLGEFPDRLSDQGEHPSTPMPRKATDPDIPVRPEFPAKSNPPARLEPVKAKASAKSAGKKPGGKSKR